MSAETQLADLPTGRSAAPEPTSPDPATEEPMNTVLVTGGTGYIGGWAIVALLQAGHRVRTTIRSPNKAEAVRAAVATVVDPADRLEFVVADLTEDAGWDQAMTGIDHVLHVASPLAGHAVDDPDELILPAREGTLRVLRHAAAAGVKRVVMTSAANAASPASYTEDSVTDETLWTIDDPSLPAYRRSKTLAEKAAWDWLADHPGELELVTVLPGAVFGPILSPATVGSVDIIARMLSGKMAGCPRIGLEVVDVRDLVDLHLLAMVSPVAAGQRYLGTGEFAWMQQIAQWLKADLGPAAVKVKTRIIPNWLVRLAARRDPGLASIAISLGRRNRHRTDKAREQLGWTTRPVRETVDECARSLVDQGVAGG